MQPVYPAVGGREDEPLPSIRQEEELWNDAPRSPRVTRKNSKMIRRGDPMEERSRIGPSTPSPRVSTHLSGEIQDALARSIIDKLSVFQQRMESQMADVALEARRLQREEHDLVTNQLSDCHRGSLQFSNDNRVWREEIQRSIMAIHTEQRRLEATSRALHQKVQDQAAVFGSPMEGSRRPEIPIKRVQPTCKHRVSRTFSRQECWCGTSVSFIR